MVLTDIEYKAVVELLNRAHTQVGVIQDSLIQTYIDAALNILKDRA